jgi:hypothetical protein
MLLQDIVSEAVPKLEPRWLKVPAAVAYSNLSRAKLYSLMSEGQIRSASIRSKGRERGIRIVDRFSIDRFMENNITAGTSAK